MVFFSDNFGWEEPDCSDRGVLRGAPTPRIDNLASEGLPWLNFNAEAQRAPSQSAIPDRESHWA